MLMSNLLKNRKSTRDFKKKDIDNKSLNRLLEILKEIEEEAGNKHFNFVLFQDGNNVSKLLDGIAGYSGVMIKSPHYIGIKLKEVTKESLIVASYYSEKMIGRFSQLNLGSCWVDVKNVDEDIKSVAFGDENKDIGYVIAIGYPKAKNPFLQEPISERDSVENIVFKEELGSKISFEELASRGLDDLFYYIRYAPSSYNKQPWKFVLKKDKVTLYLEVLEEGKVNFMDAGIIMYYFEALASTIGINGKWSLIDAPDEEYNNNSYRPIGEYKV